MIGSLGAGAILLHTTRRLYFTTGCVMMGITKGKHQGKPLTSRKAPEMTTINNIDARLYGMDHIQDTKIINGTTPDDTVRILMDNGIIVYGGFSEDDPDCFLFTSYTKDDEGFEEILSEGGYYECGDDTDADIEGIHKAILRFVNL